MKKILIALLSAFLALASCTKEEMANPYRMIVEYTPSSFTMEVSGALTPNEEYDWITVSTSGNTANFAVRRNTTGLIRRAEFSIAGGGVAVISQRQHELDAQLFPSVNKNLVDYNGTAEINVFISTGFADDYASWGLIYGTENDVNKGITLAADSKPVAGVNSTSLKDLTAGKDYFVWAYITSTENDKLYSGNSAVIMPPVIVRNGDNLQAAIDGAKEFAEVRVESGAVFGPVVLRANVPVTGGWRADFSCQDLDNKTVIDAQKKDRPINADAGNASIQNFEIKNGYALGNDGGACRINNSLTIKDCYIHHCTADGSGGAFAQMDNSASDFKLINSIVSNCISYDHGGFGRFQVGKVKIIGCLIEKNECRKQDGYSVLEVQGKMVETVVVNNTFLNNINWPEWGGEWPAVVVRGGGKEIIANNIFANQRYYIDGIASADDKRAQAALVDYNNLNIETLPMQDTPLSIRSIEDILFLKNICQARDAARISTHNTDNPIFKSGVIHMPLTAALSTILTSDYAPVGPALNAGDYSTDVAGIVGPYPVDLAGSQRVNDGKISIGCYAE